MRDWLIAELQRTHPSIPAALVPGQSALIALAFLASAAAAIHAARRQGYPLHVTSMGLALCFAGALIGSRLLGAALALDLILADPSALLDPRRVGSSSFGALLGGAAAFGLYARSKDLDPWRYADAVAPSAGLGLFFARIGCLLHGCDFGAVTTAAWGLRYPPGSPAMGAHARAGLLDPGPVSASLPTHPLPILLALWALTVFLLFTLRPRLGRGPHRRPGERALAAAALYLTGRLVIELFRAPEAAPNLGPLNAAQWLCVAALLVIALVWRARGAGSTPPPAPQQEHADEQQADRGPSTPLAG